jgi:hypothetical protein
MIRKIADSERRKWRRKKPRAAPPPGPAPLPAPAQTVSPWISPFFDHLSASSQILSTPVMRAQNAASAPLNSYDQSRVDKWVRDRVLVDWRDNCWHCRKPFIAGQKLVDVRGEEVTARLHQSCHVAWLAQQETLARKAMELTETPT